MGAEYNRGVDKARCSKTKAPFLEANAKACQLDPDDRPRPRPQLDQANNFSIDLMRILHRT